MQLIHDNQTLLMTFSRSTRLTLCSDSCSCNVNLTVTQQMYKYHPHFSEVFHGTHCSLSEASCLLRGEVCTFLQGAEQVVEMLCRLLIVPFDLHVFIWIEKLRVSAVSEKVLIVQLKVPQNQLVLVCPHRLELKHKWTDISYFQIQNGYICIFSVITIITITLILSFVPNVFSDVKTVKSCLLFNLFGRALEGPFIQ